MNIFVNIIECYVVCFVIFENYVIFVFYNYL